MEHCTQFMQGWDWDPGCFHVSQASRQQHAISWPYLFNLAAYKSMAINLDNAGQGSSYPRFGEDKLRAESGPALLGLPAFLPHHPSLLTQDSRLSPRPATSPTLASLTQLPLPRIFFSFLPWPSLPFPCLSYNSHYSQRSSMAL